MTVFDLFNHLLQGIQKTVKLIKKRWKAARISQLKFGGSFFNLSLLQTIRYSTARKKSSELFTGKYFRCQFSWYQYEPISAGVFP